MKNADLDQIRTLRGKNIVIAASAGCGKTTAMISRIADLIVRDGVPVKKLLVLTFTKASAADMTEKLAAKLRQASPGSPFVRRQLEDLESADICTLDKFCQRVLRDYFYLCDLDPAFGVLENDEKDFLEWKVFDRLYAERLEEHDPGFFALTEILRQGRTNAPLYLTVRRLNEFCELSEDPEAYLKEGMFAGMEPDLEKNPAFLAAAEQIRTFCAGWAGRLKRQAGLAASAGLALDGEALTACAGLLEVIERSSPDQILTRLHGVCFPELKQLDREQKSEGVLVDLHEQSKAVKNSCKKAFDKLKADFPDDPESFTRAALCDNERCLRALSDFTLRFREAAMAEKKKQSRLTFSDIEHLCLRVLCSEAGPEIRERYDAVFVDECQDINALQDAVIRKVARPGSLFCVGDLKQSIYRFRGAEPDLFSARCAAAADHPEDQLFRLGTNYRTDVRVLEAVNAVFSRLMTPGFARIDYRNEDLLSGVKGSGLSDDRPVEVRAVAQKKSRRAEEADEEADEEESDAVREGRLVAGIIRELTDGHLRFTDPAVAAERAARGLSPTVCYDDIAVLVRGRNSTVRTVMQVLKERSVPVSAEFDASPEDYPEILLLLDFLKILDNARQDIPLTAVMRSFLGGFTDRELGEIRASAPRDVSFFWDCLRRCAKEGRDEALRQKCGDFLDRIARLREAAGRLEVGELLALICREYAVESWLCAQPGGREKAAVLQNFLLSLEGKKQAETLCGYLDYLSRFSRPPLSVELSAGSRGAVHLTTIHKSKGLEYPIVILCGLSSPFRLSGEPDPILFDREIGACMNYYDPVARQVFPSFAMSAGKARRRTAALREELNTLYVAMTRPKYKLILTASFDPEKEILVESDADIREITRPFPVLLPILREAGVFVDLSGGEDADAEPPAPVTLNARPNPLTEGLEAGSRAAYAFPESLGLPRKSTVTELSRAEASFLSASGEAAAALEGPLSPPTAREGAADRGTAYHLALELLDLSRPSPEEVREQLEGFLAEGAVTPEQFAQLRPDLLAACLSTLSPLLREGQILREQPFLMETEQPGGFLLVQGKIDLLILRGREAVIVDYKFSAHSDEQLRALYAPQLDRYAEAVRRAGFEVKAAYLYTFGGNRLIPV